MIIEIGTSDFRTQAGKLDKKITNIDCLKIDTEGHDTVIVNDFLDTVSIRPKEIIFEANELSKRTEVNKTITKLQKQGYKVNTFRTDVVAKKL